MLRHVLDAWGGALPPDVVVAFCNTGKEMPETLDFVQECASRWGVHITWLEWRDKAASPDGMAFEVVSHNSASRNGEPFKALIDKRGYLPNPVTRFCTLDLKIRTAERWLRSTFGWDDWASIVGLRADEPDRVARTRARAGTSKDRWDTVVPLASAGVTKEMVKAFWDAQPFDLRLPNVGGVTPLGNCDLCFMKGAATLAEIIRQRPELAVWWAEAEAEARASKPSGARFRQDRPPYKGLAMRHVRLAELRAYLDDDTRPCGCTD